MTWTDYRDDLDHHFNPSGATTEARDRAELERGRLAEAAHAALGPRVDLRYGPGPRQLLDLFPAQGPARLMHVYVHGGYWRRGDRRLSAFGAEPLVRRGIAHAAVGYDLCPDVTLEALVEEIRDALAWLHREAVALGVPGGRLFITGHSAGAHLCAMALACDWAACGIEPGCIAGAALLSGVYELEAVRHVNVQEQVQLTEARARALSPTLHPPRVAVPVLFATGEREAAGWIDQTNVYAEVCRRAGCAVEVFNLPGADHHGVPIAAMGHERAPVLAAMLRAVGG